MVYNLFFVDNRTSWSESDSTIEGWKVGPSNFKVRTTQATILASHNGKDLFHYVTTNRNHAKTGRTFNEFIGDNYIEIVLGSLLGTLPAIIAKKIVYLRYEISNPSYPGLDEEEFITKTAPVEQWELDGSPTFDKVLPAHKYFGVDIDY